MTSWPHLRADTDRTVNSRLAGDRTEDVIVKYSNDIILLIRMYLRVSDDHLTQWSPGQPGVYNHRTPPTRETGVERHFNSLLYFALDTLSCFNHRLCPSGRPSGARLDIL